MSCVWLRLQWSHGQSLPSTGGALWEGGRYCAVCDGRREMDVGRREEGGRRDGRMSLRCRRSRSGRSWPVTRDGRAVTVLAHA